MAQRVSPLDESSVRIAPETELLFGFDYYGAVVKQFEQDISIEACCMSTINNIADEEPSPEDDVIENYFNQEIDDDDDDDDDDAEIESIDSISSVRDSEVDVDFVCDST